MSGFLRIAPRINASVGATQSGTRAVLGMVKQNFLNINPTPHTLQTEVLGLVLTILRRISTGADVQHHDGWCSGKRFKNEPSAPSQTISIHHYFAHYRPRSDE